MSSGQIKDCLLRVTGKIDTTLLPVGKKKRRSFSPRRRWNIFFFYTFFLLTLQGPRVRGNSVRTCTYLHPDVMWGKGNISKRERVAPAER
jgi:hypothetical protein